MTDRGLVSYTRDCEFRLSKFILHIIDIGEGKLREESWAYNPYRFQIANPHAFYV